MELRYKDLVMVISIQDEIERRHDLVGLFKDQAGLRGSLRDGPLRSCPDLDALKTKMQRKRAGLMEVPPITLNAQNCEKLAI